MKVPWTQVSGIADRALLMLGMYAVGRGWISESEMMQLVAVLIGIAGVIWGAYVNTDKSLQQSAAAIPGTVVITTQDLADATPNEKNIISTSSSKETIVAAVAKAAAEIKPTTETKPS